MERFEGDSVAEDNAYQAALYAGKRYAVLSNDEERCTIYYATWQEANAVCDKLQESVDMDTKFWVEAA